MAALASVLVVTAASVVRADPPVYLWGFQSRCESMPDADISVEKDMFTPVSRIALVRSASAQALPPCYGEQCGEAFRGACGNTTGRLLGGQVVKGKTTTRFRLWLYDLGTRQIAYQDDYCEKCTVVAALPIQARDLIEHPRFGSAPDAKPSYCSRQATLAVPPGPVFLIVYGDGKQKPALTSALQAQLTSLDRTAVPVAVELKSHTKDDLKPIVAGYQNARVLMADAQKDGKIALYVFDQKTTLIDGGPVTCPSCDQETTILHAQEAVAELLSRCIGVQCASTAVGPPSREACEPFPMAQCAGVDALLPLSGKVENRDRLTPRTARIIKGLAWGAFTASALAAIGLFAANSTDAGLVQDPSGLRVHDALWRPAWAAAGISLGLAGLAIPITVIADHATIKDQSTGSAPSDARWVQCPN